MAANYMGPAISPCRPTPPSPPTQLPRYYTSSRPKVSSPLVTELTFDQRSPSPPNLKAKSLHLSSIERTASTTPTTNTKPLLVGLSCLFDFLLSTQFALTLYSRLDPALALIRADTGPQASLFARLAHQLSNSSNLPVIFLVGFVVLKTLTGLCLMTTDRRNEAKRNYLMGTIAVYGLIYSSLTWLPIHSRWVSFPLIFLTSTVAVMMIYTNLLRLVELVIEFDEEQGDLQELRHSTPLKLGTQHHPSSVRPLHAYLIKRRYQYLLNPF